jgi:hypothetical protein
VSAIVTLNINFYYGIGLGLGWAIPRQITVMDVSVVLAMLNVIVLVWFAAMLVEASRAGAPLEVKGVAQG